MKINKIAIFLASIFCFYSCNDNYKNKNSDFDFGIGKYNEPFPGKMQSIEEYLEPTLNWFFFNWFRTDTVSKNIRVEIEVNEEAYREGSRARFYFVDSLNNPLKDLDFFINGIPAREFVFNADSIKKELIFSTKINPRIGEKNLRGNLLIQTENFDSINGNPVDNYTVGAGTWHVQQKIGWALWPWLWWTIVVLAILFGVGALIYYLIFGVWYGIRSIPWGNIRLPKYGFNQDDPSDHDKNKKRNKKRKIRKEYDQILEWEKQLYTPLTVADKYEILEKIRLALDDLHKNDKRKFDYYEKELKSTTWEALEDSWSLWNPVPKSHVEWVGPGKMTCRLKPTHPSYQECLHKDFTQCTYNEHGSPDFDKVTFPDSIVDIADLYDSLSSESIQKRGGSVTSLQEIAQMRMVPKLRSTINKWAKETGNTEDFWEWRNSLNLVPHEDTNCRTMRLVYRPVHIAFKHRGGVANAVNIKNHFG